MKRFIEYCLIIGTLVLLSVFLIWHYRLGISRYIDVDEFAHLSWSYQMFSGRKPYIDFLLFFPPGFHVFLMPLFAIGSGVTPILAGRVFAFIVFVMLVGVTMLLFWMVRRSWAALLAGVILAFLPLPFDKFLEIRPDTLATVFAILGMIFQISRKNFLSGLAYGLSLLVLPKVLPQIVVATIVLVSFDVWKKNCKFHHGRDAKYITFPFVFGLGLPLLLFGLWVLTLGNPDQVIYSLTKLPVEANKISETFIMQPDLFFYPNTIFYGASGWSTGLLVNHAIWIVAIFVAAYRLVIPLNWSEFLIAATFFVYVIFYVLVVPLKHAQYLIPIAVFVAFYAADAVNLLWRKIIGVNFIAAASLSTLYIIGLGFMWKVFVAVNSPKLAWTNEDTIKQLTVIYQTIPTAEYILDLTGETLYYRHPYPACCIPFGQAAPYLTRPLPSLAQTLEKTQTKYVFEGGVKRITTLLPVDQAYISVHYLPYPAIAGLLVRK